MAKAYDQGYRAALAKNGQMAVHSPVLKLIVKTPLRVLRQVQQGIPDQQQHIVDPYRKN